MSHLHLVAANPEAATYTPNTTPTRADGDPGHGMFEENTTHQIHAGVSTKLHIGKIDADADDEAPTNPGVLELGTDWATAIYLGQAGVATRVQGDLVVQGTTFSTESETVKIADNHLYLNNGYETVSAQTGGLVVNYLPTGTTDTVASPGFLRGIAADVGLTGTVTTNGTTTLAGSGTSFLSELRVGQQITVDPGGGSEETRIVATITDDETLTVTAAFTTSVGGLSAQLDQQNPKVKVVTGGQFSLADIIQIAGANTEDNAGLFEVLSDSGNWLTIRGIGVTATVEDFTQNDFVDDTSTAGSIRQVNVSVIRAGDDGAWEVGSGNATPIVFTDLATGSGVANLQEAYDGAPNPNIALDASGPIVFSDNGTSVALLLDDNVALEFNNEEAAPWTFSLVDGVVDYFRIHGPDGVAEGADADVLYLAPGNGAAGIGAADGGNGGAMMLYTGNGGASAGSFNAGPGGTLECVTGSGGLVNTDGQVPGAGGSMTFGTGAGGSGGSTAGAGGAYTITCGDGAQPSDVATNVGGQGGYFQLNCGAGGAGPGVNAGTGGAGGGFLVTCGDGGAGNAGTGGDGGSVTIAAGDGGAGTTADGNPGDIYIDAGANPSSTFGSIQIGTTYAGSITLGNLGQNTFVYVRGVIDMAPNVVAETDAQIDITWQPAALTGTPHGLIINHSTATSITNAADVYGIQLVGQTNAGAGDSVGMTISGYDVGMRLPNDVDLIYGTKGGRVWSVERDSGSAYLHIAGSGTAVDQNADDFRIDTAAGRNASAIAGGDGGTFYLYLGNGGNAATGPLLAGEGGGATVLGGVGGSAFATETNAGSGGTISLTGGQGGTGAAGVQGGTGGSVTLAGGTAGSAGGGTEGTGGDVTATGGVSTTQSAGNASIVGGGTTSGAAGYARVSGGASTGAGTAGHLYLNGGAGHPTGTPGNAYLSGGASVGTTGATGSVYITTANSSTASGNIGDIEVITGNATGGTGNSGGIIIRTGTSAGGTRGSLDVDARQITVDATDLISLDAAAASNFTCSAGDLTLGGATQANAVNIQSAEADAAAVRIYASNAAGGMDVDAGTAGIAIDTTGLISIDAAGDSNLTITGNGNTLLINTTGDAADLTIGTGGSDSQIYLVPDTSGEVFIGAAEDIDMYHLTIYGEIAGGGASEITLYAENGTAYTLWVDVTGNLRIKAASTHGGDTDGVIVGTQSA